MIEKWAFRIDRMTCSYFDNAGKAALVERIPVSSAPSTKRGYRLHGENSANLPQPPLPLAQIPIFVMQIRRSTKIAVCCLGLERFIESNCIGQWKLATSAIPFMHAAVCRLNF